MIRTILYVIVAIVAGILGPKIGGGIFLLALFFGEWLYPVVFEVYRGGATPGKTAFGLVVLHDDGTPVGGPASLIRNLIRFVDFLPLAYGVGLIAMLLQRDFKRLGDLAAGTVVAYAADTKSRAEWKRRLNDVHPRPPAFPLDPEEQRAIVAYAERYPTWTKERAAELAGLVHVLTNPDDNSRGDQELLGVATWLLGRR